MYNVYGGVIIKSNTIILLQGVSLHGGKENLSYEDNTRVRGIHPAGKEMALRLEAHLLEYVLATFRGWWWGISVASDPFL